MRIIILVTLFAIVAMVNSVAAFDDGNKREQLLKERAELLKERERLEKERDKDLEKLERTDRKADKEMQHQQEKAESELAREFGKEGLQQ